MNQTGHRFLTHDPSLNPPAFFPTRIATLVASALLIGCRDKWRVREIGLDRDPDPGLAWPGLAWPGLAWPGLAWPGLAWPGLAWPGRGGAGRGGVTAGYRGVPHGRAAGGRSGGA